jgi:hypothetical protein
MRPCHAAALALVGWYLMIPPVDRDEHVHPDAPLSSWFLDQSYDTAAACEKEKRADMNKVKDVKDPWVRFAAYSEKCIATDDPRLKDK